MTQTLVSRPVAWVLSENSNLSLNLAPFSIFNAISSDPALVMLSIDLRPNGEAKDSRVNIEARKDFVIHIAHREMAPLVTQTSASLEPGVSEIDQASLKTCEFPGGRLPRLVDCRIAYACSLDQLQPIENSSQTLVIARVKQVYIDDSIVEIDSKNRIRVCAERLDPIGRLGAGEYTTFGKIISFQRPK